METTTPTKARPHARANSAEYPHFGELIRILQLRRSLLYFFTIMALTGTVFRQVFYVPMYQAEAQLSIQKAENSPMQLALANLGATQFDSSDRLKKYLDYLQSNEFFLAVAENLKFQEGYHLLNLTSPAEMSVLGKKFWLQFLQTHFGKKLGPSDPSVNVPEPVLVPVEKLASILRGMTQAEGIGTETIKIHVITLDPFTSMVLANTATEVFVKKTTERDYNEVTEVKRFIQDQLEATTDKLKRSEFDLIEFKRRHNIISINAEHSASSEKVNAIEGELQGARIKYEENQKLIDFYQKALARAERRLLDGGAAAVDDSRDETVGRLRAQLDSLHYKKVQMQAQGYAENSWQMTEVNRDLDKVAGDLKRALESATPSSPGEEMPVVGLEDAQAKMTALKAENQALQAKLDTIERSRSALLHNLESVPKDEQALLTLTRDVDLQFELYSSLKKKLQEVEIQQVALQSHVLITDRAPLPGPLPRTHLVVKILFALLVGVFLGGSAAFLIEAVDLTVKHAADLERLELVFLGSIPHIEGSSVRTSLGVHAYRPDLLICKDKPESPESMAFKYVRAQLCNHRGNDGQPVKLITITSPERGDGKSFIAANLAMSLSQLEKRTLLIDADLRNPSQPFLFGYKDGNGLSSLLTLKASLEESLLRRRLPNFDILPAGWSTPNPSELISNDKFRVLLEHLREIYDYIIIDAPPATSVVDASVMAGLSDSVILTACYRKTKKDALLMALRKILQVSHKQVYAILNDVWEHDEFAEYGKVLTLPLGQQAMGNMDARDELAEFERLLESGRHSKEQSQARG